MLHVLSVPKGAMFVGWFTGGGQFKEYPSSVTTHYVNWEDIALFFPLPGAPSIGSQEIEAGWLAQGAEQFGQKDVEQISLDGNVIPYNYFNAHAPKSPSMLYRSPTAQEYFSISVSQGSTSLVLWLSAIVPWMGSYDVVKDYVGRVGTDTVTHSWRATTCVQWLRSNVVVAFTNFAQLDSSTGYSLSVRYLKFSDDFKKYIPVNLSLAMSKETRSYTGSALMDAIAKSVLGDSILRTPTLDSASLGFKTVSVGYDQIIPPFKIEDRTDIFKGELNPVWGDLAYDCYSQIQLWNSNGLAYGKDMVLITRAARDLVRVAKSLMLRKDLPGTAKSLADLFLSFRYGWCLTAKDTISLLQADYERAYPQGRCKRSSSYSYFRNGVTITARMSVFCRPYSDCVSELAGFLSMMDFDFSLENLWDLVPWTFVIDWVVNVGDLLNRFDMLGNMDKFSIFLTGQTLKATTVVTASQIEQLRSMSGTVTAKYYKRVYGPDVIPPSLASSRNSDQKFNHWLEGSALAIQRIR
jgi:hypothetical protein